VLMRGHNCRPFPISLSPVTEGRGLVRAGGNQEAALS
jgi:hypothetical protein